MEIIINILKLSAGIGLFLFAMYLLEESLKNISGRNFKIFLQRMANNNIGAVAGGAIVTAVLQSSSMVSLMVLAFVGAGVFTMKNALAIILGANLGTTLDSWVVASLGFKVNIEIAAYPAICIGGFLMILFGNRKTVKYIAYFLFGFGLLFIGLSFMKTSMEDQVKTFDFAAYADMPLFFFLLIGFIITLLVQSSSVTMALTLSAIHAGAISFPIGAAIVLGSKTGTTIKIMLSAIGGNATKKRVVLGNFLFNVFLTTFAFIFLKPILLLITNVFNINDPLIGLVTFSSLINLLSILLFLPVLAPFAKFLEKFFLGSDASTGTFISNANIQEPQTALDLFKKEAEYFIYNSMLFNSESFNINKQSISEQAEFDKINEKRKINSKSLEEKYEYLKQWQGELLGFYLDLRSKLEGEQNGQLNQFISAIRSSMYSAKCIHDITNNINNLSRSSKDIKFDFFLIHKKEMEHLYQQLNALILEKKSSYEKLQLLFDNIQSNYTSALNIFFKEAQTQPIEDIDMTTALNFNRELFTSNKAILMAVKDFLLDEKLAENFNRIPVYHT